MNCPVPFAVQGLSVAICAFLSSKPKEGCASQARNGWNAASLLGFALCALVVLGGCAVAPPAWREHGAAIERTLDQAIAEKKFPGASFWLERAGNRQAWHRGARTYEAGAAVTDAQTIFDVASLTKVVVTATAVQMLIDEGRLGMDQRLIDHLPGCAGAGRDAITLTHLLTHTSGLPAGVPKRPAWSGRAAGLERACAQVPTHAPGTAFRYSDVNFILLGAIVERASGETLDAFAARRIFQPLRMTRTGYRPLERFPAGEIAPTLRVLDAGVDSPHADLGPGAELTGVVHDPTARFMGGVAGHAGLFSTAEDLARFARMLIDGGVTGGKRLLSKDAVARLTASQSPAGIKERRTAGWDLDSPYARPRGALFSPGSFGHTGFTGCVLWIDPAAHSFYVLLSNRVYPDEKSVIVPLYAEFGTLAARAAGVAAR
ncbi:MAG: beta-lactamase family protein [Betaproteobacteria bacterium]|nr:beta-lactamase family protein [Betaproteobacteria bacterium]